MYDQLATVSGELEIVLREAISAQRSFPVLRELVFVHAPGAQYYLELHAGAILLKRENDVVCAYPLSPDAYRTYRDAQW